MASRLPTSDCGTRSSRVVRHGDHRRGAALGPSGLLARWEAATVLLDAVPVVLGVLVVHRAPRSPVGPALVSIGCATAWVKAIETVGSVEAVAAQWPGSTAAAPFVAAVWPWLYIGYLILIAVFPDGLLAGRTWRVIAAAGPCSAVMLTLGLVGSTAGEPPTSPGQVVLMTGGLACSLGRADWRVRQPGGSISQGRSAGAQSVRRWLLLAAALVPALLIVGLVLNLAGVADAETGAGLFIGIVVVLQVLVPLAVTIAVLRHDLFDIDRLVSASVTWFLTVAVSAAIFGGVVLLLGNLVAASAELSVASAAFLTALALMPVHQRLPRAVGRIFDRIRFVRLAAVEMFVAGVRDGTAEAEDVEEVLRTAIGDADARLLVIPPGSDEALDLAGRPVALAPHSIALQTNQTEIAVLALSTDSAPRRRLAAEAARTARLPIEVSRLRLQLRRALEDVTASRMRLVMAVADERRRLERDLHDGAQQQLVAVGMRLRSVQSHLNPTSPDVADLEWAIAAIEQTLSELRRIAHGLRPAMLDDGLEPALRNLARSSPLPLDLAVVGVSDLDDELLVTTAYLGASEALTNALKHARASTISVKVVGEGGRLVVEVTDDGRGGVDPLAALGALRDRVASVGGSVTIVSPIAGGTCVQAVL